MLNVIEDIRNEFKIKLTDKQDNALKFQFGTSNIKSVRYDLYNKKLYFFYIFLEHYSIDMSM